MDCIVVIPASSRFWFRFRWKYGWYSTLACVVLSSSPQPRFLWQSDLLMWFFVRMVFAAAVPSAKGLAVFEAWEISPVSLFSHYRFLRGSRHPGLWTGLGLMFFVLSVEGAGQVYLDPSNDWTLQPTPEVQPLSQAAQRPHVYGLCQGQTQHDLWSHAGSNSDMNKAISPKT